MPTAIVHFADIRTRSREESKSAKMARLFDAAFAGAVKPGDLTAVKLHFGEPGADCYVHPVLVQAVVEKVREAGATPFLTDTNTLYRGCRRNGADHAVAAASHGFCWPVVDAPVIIADGLRGENSVQVPVAGKHFSTAYIAGAIHEADSMIVLSHFKGHMLAGFGGAMKNLAMGCAPPVGKAAQHSPRFEVDQEKCIACGECEEVCPENAASLAGGKAVIDKDACIGCGECYAHCPESAIGMDYRTDLNDFAEKISEYALAALHGKEGRAGFINCVVDVTPDCDCVPWSDAAIVPDVGFAASVDPVALDQACVDLVNQQAGHAGTHLECNLECGEDKFAGLWPNTCGPRTLEYGQEIGLGKTAYELNKLPELRHD